jgi:RimJ/RimL family protein N-acetyltransferase
MRNAVLVGERIYLRPEEPGDAEQMARHAAEEPESFFDRRFPSSQIAHEKSIREDSEKTPPENIHFAVCLKENDLYIGTVSLLGIDYVNRTAESGSWLGDAEYRGKGYGPETKYLLLEYAFDHLQLHVIMSYVWEPNTRSAAAVRRQGYRPAGRLIAEDNQHGMFRDALIFDILRDEWLAARDAWRARLAERGEG